MKRRMLAGIVCCMIACAVCLSFSASAHAYGGGGGGGGGGGEGASAGSGGKSPVEGMSPADLVRAFGTKAQKEALEKSIAEAENKFDTNAKKTNELFEDLQKTLKKYKDLKQKMDDGTASFEDEQEFFKSYKDAIAKKLSYEKSYAEQLVLTKNLDLAKEGFGGVSEEKAKKLSENMKKQAENNFEKLTKKMQEQTLEYVEKQLKKGKTYENLEKTTKAVQLGSMIAGAVVSGVGGVGGLALTTKDKLAVAVGNVLASALGGISDAMSKDKSVAQALAKGMVQGAVQTLGEYGLKGVEATNTIMNVLVEIGKSKGMEKLHEILPYDKESESANIGNMGPMQPQSAPNHSYGTNLSKTTSWK